MIASGFPPGRALRARTSGHGERAGCALENTCKYDTLFFNAEKGWGFMEAKKRLTLALGGAAVLAAEWALVRFPLFGLHGMKEWPTDLLLFGLIAAVAAGALGAKWAVFGTLAGYLAGFFCGVMFNYPGKTPGTRMGWWVWTCVFLAGIALGIAASIIFAIRKKKTA